MMNIKCILQKGLTTVEYVICVSAIAAVVIATFYYLGNTLSGNINDLSGVVDHNQVATTSDGSKKGDGTNGNSFFNSGPAPAAGAANDGAAGGAQGSSFGSGASSASTNDAASDAGTGGAGDGQYNDGSADITTTSDTNSISAGVTGQYQTGSRQSGVSGILSTAPQPGNVGAEGVISISPGDGLALNLDDGNRVTFTVSEITVIDPMIGSDLSIIPDKIQIVESVPKEQLNATEKRSKGLTWVFWTALLILFPVFWWILSRLFRKPQRTKIQTIGI